jgi:hypothetical protein
MLSVRSDDSPEQTRRVFDVYADLEERGGPPIDFERWHDLQRWLADGENNVYVPFVSALAQLMPAGATRLRRDFVSMLCLIRANALLHRERRKRDSSGRIVADPVDYKTVRHLVGALVAEAADAAVSDSVRDTVTAAKTLLDAGREFVTPKQLEGELPIGRSAVYERVRTALNQGYLADEAKKDERGMKLVLGALLPGDSDSFLPTVDDVVRLMSSDQPDNANPDEDRDCEGLSGCPASPDETRMTLPNWERAYWRRKREKGTAS